LSIRECKLLVRANPRTYPNWAKIASQTLAEHWDGTAWQIVPSANPGPGTNVLNSLARTSPGGPLRAVGLSAGGTPPTATLVETTVG